MVDHLADGETEERPTAPRELPPVLGTQRQVSPPSQAIPVPKGVFAFRPLHWQAKLPPPRSLVSICVYLLIFPCFVTSKLSPLGVQALTTAGRQCTGAGGTSAAWNI